MHEVRNVTIIVLLVITIVLGLNTFRQYTSSSVRIAELEREAAYLYNNLREHSAREHARIERERERLVATEQALSGLRDVNAAANTIIENIFIKIDILEDYFNSMWSYYNRFYN